MFLNYYAIPAFKLSLQDLSDGDDDRTAAQEASDANSAEVGKIKYSLMRLSDMSPGSNSAL